MKRTYLFLTFLLVASLFITSCNGTSKEGSGEGALKETVFKFSPSNYKMIWQKKINISKADSIIFSQSGNRIIVYSSLEGILAALDSKGNIIWRKKFPYEIIEANFSADSSKIAVSLYNQKVKPAKGLLAVFDNSGAQVWSMESPKEYEGIPSIEFSPDSKKMITVFNSPSRGSSELILFNEEGRELFKKKFEGGTIDRLAQSPSSTKLLVSTSYPSGNMKEPPKCMVVGYENGKEVIRHSLKGKYIPRFVDESKYILAQADGTITAYQEGVKAPLWQTKTKGIYRIYAADRSTDFLAQGLSFTSDQEEKTFYLSTFSLYNSEGKKIWHKEINNYSDYRAAFSPDFGKIALLPFKSNRPAVLYSNFKSGDLPQRLPSGVIDASFSPDGSKVVTLTPNGIIRLLEL